MRYIWGRTVEQVRGIETPIVSFFLLAEDKKWFSLTNESKYACEITQLACKEIRKVSDRFNLKVKKPSSSSIIYHLFRRMLLIFFGVSTLTV